MTRVITYGTFDLFHEGHYRLLQRAKGLGDYLIVGVTTEDYDKARGKLNVVDSLAPYADCRPPGRSRRLQALPPGETAPQSSRSR